MPNLNRKGPNGEGAMTGRKLGKCNPENKGKTTTSQPIRIMGCGQGKGLGYGRGKGNGQGLGLRFRRNG